MTDNEDNEELVQKLTSRVMQLSYGLLEQSYQKIDPNILKDIDDITLSTVFCFQQGVISEAGYHFGLGPELTAELYRQSLITLNGVSEERSYEVIKYVAQLIERRVPPIEAGRNAFIAFLDADDEDEIDSVTEYLNKLVLSMRDQNSAEE